MAEKPQEQIEALVAEVEHLRARLAEAPKRMRTLEERLLETKGQLSQAIARNEKLSYTLREATRFGVHWTRDLSYSFEQDQPYYVLDAIGGTVRRQIAGRVDAIVGYRQSESLYEALTSVEQGAPRRDVTRTWSADLGMRINRRWRVGLRYVQSARHSNQKTFRDYGRRQIGLSYMYGM